MTYFTFCYILIYIFSVVDLSRGQNFEAEGEIIFTCVGPLRQHWTRSCALFPKLYFDVMYRCCYIIHFSLRAARALEFVSCSLHSSKLTRQDISFLDYWNDQQTGYLSRGIVGIEPRRQGKWLDPAFILPLTKPRGSCWCRLSAWYDIHTN